MTRHSAGGSDAGYGMFEQDYRPKKSATYLHNLTTIIQQVGRPHSLKPSYAIPNQPPTVHDLLLQKSPGAFVLVVWDEKAEGTDSITVDFGKTYPSINIFDPTTGTSPIQTATNARSLPLTLSDHPVVLEL